MGLTRKIQENMMLRSPNGGVKIDGFSRRKMGCECVKMPHLFGDVAVGA
jgi:hypothetical protein